MPVEQLTNSLIHDEFLFLDLVDPSAVASCGLQKLQRIYHSATLFCFLSLRDERDFQRRESLVLISALAPSSPDCFIERIIIWILKTLRNGHTQNFIDLWKLLLVTSCC